MTTKRKKTGVLILLLFSLVIFNSCEDSGETPEATANATANGRATIPTTIPAIISAENCFFE